LSAAEKFLVPVSDYSPLTIGVRARRLEGLQPPDSGKTIIFRAKGKFFGQMPATKNEKKIICIS